MPRVPPKPSLPPKARRPEWLWSLQKAGRRIDCELHSNGRAGWECRLFDEDWLIEGYPVRRRADALAHAEEQRQKLKREGWTACD